MPVVSVVLAGLMMRSRGAIRLGMQIACRRTPTAIGFRVYSLWPPDSTECGYSVRIQCVRLHDRAIRRRFSPGSEKLEFVCMTPYTPTTTACSVTCPVWHPSPLEGKLQDFSTWALFSNFY